MTGDIIVLKIGTKTLIDDQGQIRKKVIRSILALADRRIKLGEKILIVTSGAVATGRKFLGRLDAERSIAAGVGQPQLMRAYLEEAKNLGLHILEIIISRPHLVERQQFLTLQEKINSIFSYANIIPVVNENDFLVTEGPWSFGDNDSLAAALAIAFKAKKLIIASHVGGLYTADPNRDSDAKLIGTVENVSAELMRCCSGDASLEGRGGMISKLKTARLCSAVGLTTQIVNGTDRAELERAFNNEPAGTIILPRQNIGSLKNRERWILSAKTSAGSLEIDDGAAAALRRGKSLLAVGVKKIYGSFAAGEIVEIINKKKEGLAFGVADIGSKELDNILKKETKGVQVMHADNLMVFED
mgnify:CR=1 FL=1